MLGAATRTPAAAAANNGVDVAALDPVETSQPKDAYTRALFRLLGDEVGDLSDQEPRNRSSGLLWSKREISSVLKRRIHTVCCACSWATAMQWVRAKDWCRIHDLFGRCCRSHCGRARGWSLLLLSWAMPLEWTLGMRSLALQFGSRSLFLGCCPHQVHALNH